MLIAVSGNTARPRLPAPYSQAVADHHAAAGALGVLQKAAGCSPRCHCLLIGRGKTAPDRPRWQGDSMAVSRPRCCQLAVQGERLNSRRPRHRPRCERRDGEVLLRADVLGHRLIDVETAHMIRAADLELELRDGDWVLAGVDTHRTPARLLRFLRLGTSGQEEHSFRDWARFEPLIGHTRSAGLRGPFARIRRLKPAQIADLLEDASKAEEAEILKHVHADPELEADVFEELDRSEEHTSELQ